MRDALRMKTFKTYLAMTGACLVIVAMASILSFRFTMLWLQDSDGVFDEFYTTQTQWRYSDEVGALDASPVSRARVAIGGPLGLSSKEVIYFITTEDTDGERLVSGCDYKMSGSDIDSRWWSVTLYDSTTANYVPNTDNRSSWHSEALPFNTAGQWALTISPDAQPSPWLPSQMNSSIPFDLVLRLYNPSVQTRADVPDIVLPIVEKISCR